MRTSNLPVLLMGLIGRQVLIQRVVNQLPHTRLLTLAGPGGIGKTSLAIQAAEQSGAHFPRMCFLDLSSDPDGISLSQNLAVLLREPVDEPTLLLLDNCEHLTERCAEAAEHLLRLHPRLNILATSREPLRAEGEHVLRLPPLEVPERDDAPLALAMCSSAVQLFVTRAREVCDRFDLKPDQVRAIIAICRRLDGIPWPSKWPRGRWASSASADCQRCWRRRCNCSCRGGAPPRSGSKACGRPTTGASACSAPPNSAACACWHPWGSLHPGHGGGLAARHPALS
ncbi:ATP-binding protein [Azotobacter chroococcum]